MFQVVSSFFRFILNAFGISQTFPQNKFCSLTKGWCFPPCIDIGWGQSRCISLMVFAFSSTFATRVTALWHPREQTYSLQMHLLTATLLGTAGTVTQQGWLQYQSISYTVYTCLYSSIWMYLAGQMARNHLEILSRLFGSFTPSVTSCRFMTPWYDHYRPKSSVPGQWRTPVHLSWKDL